MRAEHTLTVGTIPLRKGLWLGIEQGSEWRALAKFRSEAAADEFLAVMRLAGVPEADE